MKNVPVLIVALGVIWTRNFSRRVAADMRLRSRAVRKRIRRARDTIRCDSGVYIVHCLYRIYEVNKRSFQFREPQLIFISSRN